MISINNLFENKKVVETGKTVENQMKKDDGDEIDERGKPKLDGSGPRGIGRRNQTDDCRGNK